MKTTIKPTLSKKEIREAKIAALERLIKKLAPKEGEARSNEYKSAVSLRHYYRNPKVREAYVAKLKAKPKTKVTKKLLKEPKAKPPKRAPKKKVLAGLDLLD